MTGNIPDIFLSRISELITDRMGLYFPTKHWPDLRRGIHSAVSDSGFKDIESFIQGLLSSPLTRRQIEILAGYLTVGETYFFRNNSIFEALVDHVLPGLIRTCGAANKQLRIWSAGCATGEEPYSIAILLSRMIPDIKSWNIRILATDINPIFLHKASEGLYSEWSFHGTNVEIKKQYFEKTVEGQYQILPGIKKLVGFSYLNLAEDPYPSLLNDTNAMDVILCRNVLMYFDRKRQRMVVSKLYSSLLDGGWLIVSPCETSCYLFSRFETVNFPGTVLYKKDLNRTDQRRIPPPIGSNKIKDTVPFPAAKAPVDASFEIPRNFNFPIQTGRARLHDVQWERPKTDTVPIIESILTPYEAAHELYVQGRYAEVIEKIARPDQDDPEAMALAARSYANQGMLTEALKWCEKALAADRLNPGFHFLMATILHEQGKSEDAKASLKRVLYLDPDFVAAYFVLGNLYGKQENFNESKRYFTNAMTLLKDYKQAEVLPESDGMTAGRLSEIITSMINGDKGI